MRPPSLPPVSDNARRSGWKWIAAGIACVFSPFSLPMLWELMNPILARSLPRVWLGLEFAAFLAVPLWIICGVIFIHRGRMMLIVGTPEEVRERRREFDRRVREAEEQIGIR
jgi:hypothetical protein